MGLKIACQRKRQQPTCQLVHLFTRLLIVFIVFSYSLALAQCVERATGNMFASGYIRILQCSQSIRL